MKTRLGMLTILSAFALVVFGQPALAHNLWLNPADHYPPVGSTVDIGIGWGHTYPADTPVAIVCSAGYADKEKVLHATLGTILDQVGQDRLPFEYLLYVGDFLNNSVDRLAVTATAARLN